MPRKLLEPPPGVARRFVEDMRAFHAEPNAIKRDEIAVRQLHALRPHYAGYFSAKTSIATSADARFDAQ